VPTTNAVLLSSAADEAVPLLSQPELINIVDSILRLDDMDDNGLIEYSEFVAAMRRNSQQR